MMEKRYPIDTAEVETEYQELAARLNYGGSLYLPRILKIAFTLEQARVALAFDISVEEISSLLGIRPEVAADDVLTYQLRAIAKKLSLDEKMVAEHVNYMFELGYAFPTRSGWRWAKTVLQLRDSQSNTKYDEKLGDAYFDLWKAFDRLEVYPAMLPPVFAAADESGPRFRVIPSRKSVESHGKLEPEDDLAEIFSRAATLAVVHCPCKRLVRDRTPETPDEVCIICDRIAEHNIRRGTARVIDVAEALSIHDMATDAGLVCLPPSNEPVPKMICHCHYSACGTLTPAVMLGYPLENLVASSCYAPEFDETRCDGCGECLEVCQFGAISLTPEKKAATDTGKCLGCGLCVTACPEGARKMVKVKSGETVPRQGAGPISYTADQAYDAGKHPGAGDTLPRPVARKSAREQEPS